MGRMLLWEGLQSRRSNVPGGFGLHSLRLKPLPQVPPRIAGRLHCVEDLSPTQEGAKWL